LEKLLILRNPHSIVTEPVTSDCENLDQRPGVKPAAVIGIALMLCSLWMFVWRGSLDGVFHFDDYSSIVENEGIREMGRPTRYLQGTRPVGIYTFAVNYRFAGLDPYAYLLTNLTIHLVNGILLFAGTLLSWRIYQERWKAAERPGISYSVLFAAAVISSAWIVHPITTQAVTYIVQRFESLASLGYLGAWVGVLIYLRGRKILGSLLACGFAWLGLLSKEVFVSAPLSLLLFDRLFTRDSFATIIKHRSLPYLLMLTPLFWFIPNVMPLVRPASLSGVPTTTPVSAGFALETITPWQYLRTQPEVIWHYLYLTVWPKRLCIDYVWRIQDNPFVYIPLGASMIGLLAFGVASYWRATSGHAPFSFGLAGWLMLTFFFILAPTSSVIPIADIAFEHRVYLASASVIAGICLLGRLMAIKLLHESPRPAVLGVAFICIVCSLMSLLAWRTHLRNLDYRSELTLWQTAVDAAPLNPRAWYHLGQEHYKRRNLNEALPALVKAVGYCNTSVPLYDAALAKCLNDIGRTNDAVTLYRRALKTSPNDVRILNDMGVLFMQHNHTSDAMSSLVAAAELGFPTAIYNLGILQKKLGNVEGAIDSFQRALELQPTFTVAARRLAWNLATAPDAALRDGRRAIELFEEDHPLKASNSAYGWDAYAAALAEVGRFDDAVESADRALELARQADQQNLVVEIEKRLALYKAGRPHRDDGSDQDGVSEKGPE
jgi:protein O-mannosyl-transferase